MAEAEQNAWTTMRVVLVCLGVLVMSIGVMVLWAWLFVGYPNTEKYTSAGTFGDAFAPVTGLFTALALFAALASVLMQRRELEEQRKEMREAREQFTAQAQALAKANELAELANELARSAQALEASKQIADLDRIGIGVIDALKERYAALPYVEGQSPPRIGDPAAMWLEFARVCVDEPQRLRYFASVDRVELAALAKRKRDLERTLAVLTGVEPALPKKSSPSAEHEATLL